VVRHDVGTYRYTVVFLPDELARLLPLDRHPRLRISGEVGDLPFSGAWQPVRGRWYLMLSKPLLRDAGLRLGDAAEIRFRVEDQEAVEVPEALRQALAADPLAEAAWRALSAGRRRGLAHRVAAAKTPATAARRLAEVLEALRAGPMVTLRAGPQSTA
jgi:hypothetical protein